MRLSISILVFAIFSSLVFTQNEEESKKSVKMNILEPEFKGSTGNVGFQEFIEENLLTPFNAQNWGMGGAVVIRFKVFPNQNLSEFQIIHGLSPDFDKAVIEALEASNGMWNLGTINGRPVPMEKEAPVTFKIEGTEIYYTAPQNKIEADDLLKEGKYGRAIKLYSKAI
jgi:hypothetical protein